MTIDELAAKLPNARKRSRHKLTANCPLHPDDGRKLLAYSEFGSIVIECENNCADNDVARALGLTAADLFDDDDDSFLGGLPPVEDEEEVNEAAGVLPRSVPPAALPSYGTWRTNAFDLKPAGEWLAESAARPVPLRLFGDFWFEGEVSILFADTGKGKSILAVQIAESVARGTPIAPFAMELPAGEKVLYYDFELSDKMFESRYSRSPAAHATPAADLYPFSPNFFRAQLALHREFPDYYESWSEYITESFDELVRETGARLLIVDNITCLSTRSTERAGGAANIMKVMRQFQREYGLSILVLAHTPKRRFSRGITVNDLQGSKMLANFADNIFAIGESCLGENIRYLKHIKPRNSRLVHGASNVVTYQIEKETNFLSFKFLGFSHEREHIEQLSLKNDLDRKLLAQKVKRLAEGDMSLRQIGLHLGISRTTVMRILRES